MAHSDPQRDRVGGGAAPRPVAGRRVDAVPDVVLPDLPGRAVAVCSGSDCRHGCGRPGGGHGGGAARRRVERYTGQQMGAGAWAAGRCCRQLDLPVRRAFDGSRAVGAGRGSGQPANARRVKLPHADGRSATAGSPGGTVCAQRHPGRRARQSGGGLDSGYRRVSHLRVGRIGAHHHSQSCWP